MNNTDISYQQIAKEGLWNNNPALVQLLGLCPLLAVSNSLVNGIGLGLATIFVLFCSNTCVSLTRHWIPTEIRVPIFVMLIATFVTSIQLIMSALTYELYLILGIFIPLIVTNCVILGRADAFASRQPVLKSSLDGLMQGSGFALILMALGFVRELLGQGTVFAQMDLLLGEVAKDWILVLSQDYQGFLLAILPPGAFITLGCFIAIKKSLESKKQD